MLKEFDKAYNETKHMLIAFRKDIGYAEVYLKYCKRGRVYSTPFGKISYNGIRSNYHLISTLKKDGYKLYYTDRVSVQKIHEFIKTLNLWMN